MIKINRDIFGNDDEFSKEEMRKKIEKIYNMDLVAYAENMDKMKNLSTSCVS